MGILCRVDGDAFAKKCTVPLVPPPAWQAWAVWHVVDKSTSEDRLASDVANQLRRWLGNGNVDSIEVSRPTIGGASGTVPWPVGEVLARKEDCAVGEGATIEPGREVAWVPVRFVYRGHLNSLGWPVNSGFWNTNCPSEAEWLLDAAYKLGDPPPVPVQPKKETMAESVGGALREVVAQATPRSAKQVIGYGVVAAALWWFFKQKRGTRGTQENTSVD